MVPFKIRDIPALVTSNICQLAFQFDLTTVPHPDVRGMSCRALMNACLKRKCEHSIALRFVWWFQRPSLLPGVISCFWICSFWGALSVNIWYLGESLCYLYKLTARAQWRKIGRITHRESCSTYLRRMSGSRSDFTQSKRHKRPRPDRFNKKYFCSVNVCI